MHDGRLIEGFRLSPQQRRVWLLQRESQAYHAQCAILIEGELDKEVLKNALYTIIDRHEILRTTFYLSPQQRVRQDQESVREFPLQRVSERSELADAGVWKEVELLEDERRLEGIFQQARQAPFNLDEGPLLRTSLLEVSQSRHLLLVHMHALCADQTTLRNLFAEIVWSYKACLTGEAIQEQPLQYADISEWQNELLKAKDTELGRAYWQKQDFMAATETRLPYEKPSAVQEEFTSKQFSAALDSHQLERLDALAAQYDVPLAVVLLAGWRVLLWRLTGGDAAVLVGTSYDGRKYEQLRSALGLLNRFLPVQQRLVGTLPFSHVMRQLHDLLNELEKWQEYFSWEGQAESNLNGRSIPFMPFLFNFEQYPATLKTHGVSFKFYKAYACLDRFKIQLTCARTEHSLNTEFHYAARNSDAESIRRLARQFEQLLQSVIENPETVIDELEILSETERNQLIKEFNQTETHYPSDKAIHQLFEQQVKCTPARVAVICRGRQLTYVELNGRANQVAHVLRKSGVGPETPVGLMMERSVEMIVGLLGILKAGGAYVPLNPEHPPARLLVQLAELKAPVVLTQEEMLDHFPNFDGELICLEAGEVLLTDEDVPDQHWTGTPQQLVYVIYTSGSTGTPKGVSISHRNLVNYTHYICEKLGLHEGSANEPLGFATVSTLSADLGNTCIFPSLVSGGCLHIISYDVATDAALFSDYASTYPFDVLKIVPSHLRQLLSTSEGNRILPRRFLITGGEALTPELARQITRLGKGCQLLNHYGPTETTVGSVVNSKVTATLEAFADTGLATSVPIGRPVANTEVYILGSDLQPVPIGVVGELYIGGEGVGRGYFKRPDLTAEKFLPDPYSQRSGARLYSTGDLARFLADGNVEFIGRRDDQVKIRGYRVELGEIEAALQQHPAVAEAVVIARADKVHEHQRLLAYFVAQLSAAERPTVGALRSHLKGLLPGYMVPHAIMELQRLPLSANGKLDRGALPEAEVAQADGDAPQLWPRTAAEESLGRIWAEVLGIPQPGIHDNFFELGGDSIISIQIVSRARQAGLQLSPRQMFEHPTIAELARVAGRVSGKTQAEQGVVSGKVPLTPIQQWFFEQELKERHHFNQAVLLQVQQQLKVEVLEEAVSALVQHHDGLRLRYRRSEQGWEQFNAAAESHDIFRRRDLSALAAGEQTAVLEAEAAQWQGSLDLEAGPLLRAVYFDLGGERAGRLLLIIHHLAVDGVSWRILLADLQRACEQLQAGEAVQLGEKSSSYKQWAERLEEYAESAAVRGELEYWTAARRREVKGLRVDNEAAAEERMGSSRSVSVELSGEETQWLLQEVGEAYGTQIQEVLLTALVAGVRRWSGERKVLVDLEGHGREEVGGGVEVTRTVGWFTSIYPVLLEVAEESEAGQALKQVKEEMRGVPERGIGYGLLRYLSRDEELRKRLREMPPADMRFNYLGQFDQSIGEESMFGLAPESAGPNRSPRDKRITKLTINGSVVGGRLQVTWTYGENRYKQSTIEKLAQHYIEALRELIEQCRLPEAGGYTPSDFPEADLNQNELDELLAKFSRSEVQS